MRRAPRLPNPGPATTISTTTQAPAVTHLHANEDPGYPYFFFYGHAATKPTGVLSQWSDTSFSDGGVTFQTAEHYMMYHKAQLFEPQAAGAILAAPGPAEAKALGRRVKNYDHKVRTA